MPLAKAFSASSLRRAKKQLKDAADKWLLDAWAFVTDWEKFRDIAKNNYELGLLHLDRGNISDALLRLKFVLWLHPNYRDSWYYLGCAYLAEGRLKRAKEAFDKALALDPGSEEARYMRVIACEGKVPAGDLPRRIPPSLAIKHFDRQAPDFIRRQTEEMQYQGHRLLADAIRAQLAPGRLDHAMLELGTGPGLCGSLLRDVAFQLTGVDLSPAMLEEAGKLQDAQGARIYNMLVNGDAQEFLKESPAGIYDVVLACGLVSYLGDLKDFFTHGARVLKPGGLLAFTADKGEQEGVRFDADWACFRFSQSYLRGLAAEAGLTEVQCDEVSSYPDYPVWLCVFRK